MRTNNFHLPVSNVHRLFSQSISQHSADHYRTCQYPHVLGQFSIHFRYEFTLNLEEQQRMQKVTHMPRHCSYLDTVLLTPSLVNKLCSRRFLYTQLLFLGCCYDIQTPKIPESGIACFCLVTALPAHS